MSIDLTVPEVGESVTEINIGQWLKSEGDEVKQDEPLVELESEKATLDLRAPAAGVLAKILKKSGDTAEVGEVIGQIEERAGRKPAEKAETESSSAKEKAKKEEKKAVVREEDEKPVTSPAKAKVGKREETPVAESLRDSEVAVSEKLPYGAERGEERVPMSPVRRRIAARLVEAQQNAALLTTFNEIDMTAVKELRARHGEAFLKRHQVKLGFMSFFVKAAIEALRQCRELNATIDGDDIVYRNHYDLGVAISADKGLIVPVLKNAEQMSFSQIEKAIDDFATRAREGSLKVDELQGGTFTITNGGVFGSLLSTPIVNPPQSGVLGMHAIQNRPVAISSPRTGEGTGEGLDQIVIRPMMYVALTYDHRIVDGREAVTFLRRIKETIEEPARLLIDI